MRKIKSLISVIHHHQGLQVQGGIGLQVQGGIGPLVRKKIHLQVALMLVQAHQGVHQELLQMVMLIDKFLCVSVH